jgi:hypothetical protein
VDQTRAAAAPIQQWAALGGVVYVVLFVIGNILIFSGTPSGDDPPAKFRSYFSDSGHRDRIGFGWVLAGLGVFFLLWFIGALREEVRSREGGGILTTMTAIGGSIYAALAFAAIALDMGVRTMSDDTYQHRVYPGIIHAADDASYIMHATGTAGLAATLVAVSLAILRFGGLPRWLAWFGLVAAVAALASIVFFTMAVWGAWILVASVLLYMRGGTTGVERPASTPT